jgi:hypothetical protein
MVLFLIFILKYEFIVHYGLLDMRIDGNRAIYLALKGCDFLNYLGHVKHVDRVWFSISPIFSSEDSIRHLRGLFSS